MQKIRPFLWFDGQAEEAVAFYLGLQGREDSYDDAVSDIECLKHSTSHRA